MKRKGCKLIIFLSLIAIFVLSIFYNLLFNRKNLKIERSENEFIFYCRYMGYACGDLTPQMMPINMTDFYIDENQFGLGFTFYINPGSIAPDQIDEICVPGNEFEIKGFNYYYIKGNKKYLHQRFDLLQWKPLMPCKIWTDEGEIKIVYKLDYFAKYLQIFDKHAKHFILSQKYVKTCN